MLVIPILKTNYGVIETREDETFAQEGGFWIGVYVFKLTTNGFMLRGGITHTENATDAYSYAVYYNQQVNRALYIGNTLYTVSNTKLKLNSLDTLALITEVNLR